MYNRKIDKLYSVGTRISELKNIRNPFRTYCFCLSKGIIKKHFYYKRDKTKLKFSKEAENFKSCYENFNKTKN